MVVSLVGFLVLAVPVGVLAHQGHRSAGEGEHAARLLAAAPTPAQYQAFTTAIAPTPKGHRTWSGHRYAVSAWTSPWVTPKRAFTRLVPSWTASTPAGSWIQVLVQVRDGSGRSSGVKDLGRWATGDATLKRSSAGSQSDTVAKVATDTLLATGTPLTGYRLTVRLMRSPGGAAPRVTTLGAVTSTSSSSLPATSTPLSRKPVQLAVPGYSQMTHRGHAPRYGGGGEAWCSPTSLAMVLGYYGRLPAASTYRWVPKGTDRFVDHVARLTYDHAYRGTGNWPFNTAYAATRTGRAFVTRLANLRMAERFVRAGIPVVVSVRFAKGQLTGAPISSTPGHLMVLTGFTAAGDPVVNDPAAPTNRSVRRTYDRGELERAWLRGSDGTAYVITDAGHPLPKRPTGVLAW